MQFDYELERVKSGALQLKSFKRNIAKLDLYHKEMLKLNFSGIRNNSDIISKIDNFVKLNSDNVKSPAKSTGKFVADNKSTTEISTEGKSLIEIPQVTGKKLETEKQYTAEKKSHEVCSEKLDIDNEYIHYLGKVKIKPTGKLSAPTQKNRAGYNTYANLMLKGGWVISIENAFPITLKLLHHYLDYQLERVALGFLKLETLRKTNLGNLFAYHNCLGYDWSEVRYHPSVLKKLVVKEVEHGKDFQSISSSYLTPQYSSKITDSKIKDKVKNVDIVVDAMQEVLSEEDESVNLDVIRNNIQENRKRNDNITCNEDEFTKSFSDSESSNTSSLKSGKFKSEHEYERKMGMDETAFEENAENNASGNTIQHSVNNTGTESTNSSGAPLNITSLMKKRSVSESDDFETFPSTDGNKNQHAEHYDKKYIPYLCNTSKKQKKQPLQSFHEKDFLALLSDAHKSEKKLDDSMASVENFCNSSGTNLKVNCLNISNEPEGAEIVEGTTNDLRRIELNLQLKIEENKTKKINLCSKMFENGASLEFLKNFLELLD
ncbi:hypothetical protein HDU92_006660 [Lobulomyces angularis]|nr:hypothetical protein HDU92_006660 [Lobulomyces angularis]